jgi:hypothetical protein
VQDQDSMQVWALSRALFPPCNWPFCPHGLSSENAERERERSGHKQALSGISSYKDTDRIRSGPQSHDLI